MTGRGVSGSMHDRQGCVFSLITGTWVRSVRLSKQHPEARQLLGTDIPQECLIPEALERTGS